MFKNRKGFTLIEIIVVIVIIAVLMAIAIPSVMSYMKEGNEAKYLAVSRTVYTKITTELVKTSAESKDTGATARAIQGSLKKINNSSNGDVFIYAISINYKGYEDRPDSITVGHLINQANTFVTCNLTIDDITSIYIYFVNSEADLSNANKIVCQTIVYPNKRVEYHSYG